MTTNLTLPIEISLLLCSILITAMLTANCSGRMMEITILDEFEIESPYGKTIYGLIRRLSPELYPRKSLATVVKVPGGINPGRMEVHSDEVIRTTEAEMGCNLFQCSETNGYQIT